MACKILKQVSLAGFKETGNTKHYHGNEKLPKPEALQLIKYDGDDGYYLFYLNENMEEMTDTYHNTIERAFQQAEWEFDIQAKDWKEVSSG